MVKDNMAWLKKEYTKLKKKYALPEFEVLNAEFEIERIATHKTRFILRKIRRRIERKLDNFLRILESFINPSFANLASIALSKSFSDKEKDLVKKSYQTLVDLMLKSITTELDGKEEKDAKFIKDTLKVWIKTKKDLYELLSSSEKIWKKKIEEERIDYNYFG